MVASLSNGQNWALHVAAVAATAAGLYFSYRTGARHAQPKKHEKVFVLAVSLTFKDVGERDKWVAAWHPMVEHVKANEPGTLGYELCIGDTEPCKCLVYERYVDRAAYADVHRSSAAMAAFKEATAKIKMSVQGQSYLESNIGFM